jgi:hypothetical protein
MNFSRDIFLKRKKEYKYVRKKVIIWIGGEFYPVGFGFTGSGGNRPDLLARHHL